MPVYPKAWGRQGRNVRKSLQGWLEKRERHVGARQWARLAEIAGNGGAVALDAELRDEAQELQDDLARFLQHADAALLSQRSEPYATQFPLGTDWIWRPVLLRGAVAPRALVAPESGRQLGGEVALWHDCPHRAVILQQIHGRGGANQAPYGVRLEVMGFAGSYLSLSLDLPDDIPGGLGRDQILRMDARLSAERAITVYARLNLTQGPDTMTLLRKLDAPIKGDGCRRMAEFDLDYAGLATRPVERAWLDMIFEAPLMNAVTLDELILSRHPRAQV